MKYIPSTKSFPLGSASRATGKLKKMLKDQSLIDCRNAPSFTTLDMHFLIVFDTFECTIRFDSQ
jgi:hypothetical protein